MKDTLTLERELLTTRALLARQEANVTALLSRIDELKAERDAIQADGEELLEENKALTLEKADLIREKHAAESRAELAECFLDLTHSAIINALEGAQLGGDYKGNMGALVEVVQRYKL